MRKWLLGHRKLVTTCIIVISILLMISSSLLFFKFQKEQNVYVELLYYTNYKLYLCNKWCCNCNLAILFIVYG